MGVLFFWVLAVIAVAVAIPVAVLFLELLAGVLRRNPVGTSSGGGSRGRVAVLVPARNESAHIAATLENIKAQLKTGDRLLVIANNCSDDTAAVASALGAEVVDRHDPQRIGKGYALDWGLRHLDDDPPDVVLSVDADCLLSDGAIDRLASACATTGRPVQALNLMTAPDGSQINHQVAEFAWRVKNWVRPLGLGVFGLPCQLMGTGMAFPWPVIRAADLANGWIVEDLNLGLDLTEARHAPLFCPEARVTSEFPVTARGADSQRQRWEQGHIVTIIKRVPRLLCAALAQANWSLLALTLDLAVPPLSLLVIVVFATLVVTGAAAALGLSSVPLLISAATLAGLAISIGLAWMKFGRDVLPGRSLFCVPTYALRKIGLYRQVLSGKVDAEWIGTDRAKS